MTIDDQLDGASAGELLAFLKQTPMPEPLLASLLAEHSDTDLVYGREDDTGGVYVARRATDGSDAPIDPDTPWWTGAVVAHPGAISIETTESVPGGTVTTFDSDPSLPNTAAVLETAATREVVQAGNEYSNGDDDMLKDAQSLIDDDIGLSLGDLVELRDEANRLNASGGTVELEADDKIQELEAYLQQANVMKDYMKSIVMEINTGSRISSKPLLEKLAGIVQQYRALVSDLREIRTQLVVSTRTTYDGVEETTRVMDNLNTTVGVLNTFFAESTNAMPTENGQASALKQYMKKQMTAAAHDTQRYGAHGTLSIASIDTADTTQDTAMLKLGAAFKSTGLKDSTSSLKAMMDSLKAVVDIPGDSMKSQINS